MAFCVGGGTKKRGLRTGAFLPRAAGRETSEGRALWPAGKGLQRKLGAQAAQKIIVQKIGNLEGFLGRQAQAFCQVVQKQGLFHKGHDAAVDGAAEDGGAQGVFLRVDGEDELRKDLFVALGDDGGTQPARGIRQGVFVLDEADVDAAGRVSRRFKVLIKVNLT